MADNIIYPEGIKAIYKFVNHVEDKCKENGVELIFMARKYIKLSEDDLECVGYFDDANKELIIAVKRPIMDWLEILVHEYSHMNQWLEKEPIYIDCKVGENCPGSMIDLWIRKEVELNEEQQREYFKKVRYMELDNERRSVDIIKLWNLPIDVDGYIRQANAYVYFYLAVEDYRKWYDPESNMFDDEDLLEAMPATLEDENDYDKLPSGTQMIFHKLMNKKEVKDGEKLPESVN